MKTDFRLGAERLENRSLLSGFDTLNLWYKDSIVSEINQINSRPVVAVVDSGISLDHEIFRNNLYKNPWEIVDGKDNDLNGYVDDISGWDFVQNDNVPQDELYHGTHVSGIVSILTENKVEILPIRFQNGSGLGYAGAAASGVHYAIDMKLKGANIVAINCSFGGLDSMPPVLDTALRRASDNGIVVVLAAGNNGVDMNVVPKYPASLKLANGISVGAHNRDGSIAGYSNTGADIYAPGSDIYSSLPNNSYGFVSGTSMAAPMVSGAVGLLKTLGNYSASQIKNAILQIKGGLLNLSESLRWLKTQSPVVFIEKPKVVVEEIRTWDFSFEVVSSRVVSGFARITGDNSRPTIQVYVNNRLRASLVVDETTNRFNVTINRKWLRYGNNVLQIRIKDPLNQLKPVMLNKIVRK